jgi:hypothetical protein
MRQKAHIIYYLTSTCIVKNDDNLFNFYLLLINLLL